MHTIQTVCFSFPKKDYVRVPNTKQPGIHFVVFEGGAIYFRVVLIFL